MRKIDEIIVHCSATQRAGWFAELSNEKQLEEIRRWHVSDNGWYDIGYHAIICRDGQLLYGRADATAGAHCLGHNATSLGVCLIGGFGSAQDDHFDDHFTPAQRDTLKKYIEANRSRYGQSIKVSGHNKYSNRACPGFNVDEFLGIAKKPYKAAVAAKEGFTKGGPVGALGGLSIASVGPAFAGWDANAQIAIIVMLGVMAVATALYLIKDMEK